MKNNNFNNELKSNAERMLFLLPKSCNCHTCVETKSYIKNELGETKFFSIAKKVGITV